MRTNTSCFLGRASPTSHFHYLVLELFYLTHALVTRALHTARPTKIQFPARAEL